MKLFWFWFGLGFFPSTGPGFRVLGAFWQALGDHGTRFGGWKISLKDLN